MKKQPIHFPTEIGIGFISLLIGPTPYFPSFLNFDGEPEITDPARGVLF